MRRLETSAFEIAQRFVGTAEVPGKVSNPAILAMLQLDQGWPQDDEVPWCSAFVNYVAWLLRLPRSKILTARSWLGVGEALDITVAAPGFDVVVLQRAGGAKLGPEILDAPGHVGWFAGWEPGRVLVLGGNQGSRVSVAPFPQSLLLGVRRLA